MKREIVLLSRVCCLAAAFMAVLFEFALAAAPMVAGRTRDQWRERLAVGDAASRIQAANALSQFPEVPVRELAIAMEDDDPSVRYWAVHGLKRWKPLKDSVDDQLVAASLHSGAADKSAAVRIETAAALARRGAIDTALGILKTELDNPVEGARIQAVAALEDMGDGARPLLLLRVQQAQEDGSEYVKRIATRIVERLGK